MSYLKGATKSIEYPVEITLMVLDEDDNESAIVLNPIVQFKRFRRSEARKVQSDLAKLSKEAAEAFEAGDLDALFGDRLSFFDDLLMANVLGWRKMPGQGEDDEDVKFSKAALKEAIELNEYFAGLMAGLRRALGWGDGGDGNGSEAEVAKNS